MVPWLHLGKWLVGIPAALAGVALVIVGLLTWFLTHPKDPDDGSL